MNSEYYIDYIIKIVDYIKQKYNIKNINYNYNTEYKGFILNIINKSNKELILFIDVNDINIFIQCEKVRDINVSEKCKNLNNQLYKNFNSLISKSYYFYNINDLNILDTNYKFNNKINDIYNFNNLLN